VLDLVEHLATSAGKAPILLVCLTREELDEERPDFPKGAARLALEPLSDTETDELADHLLPQFGLDDETRDRLVAAAEGNPLFLEQLVAHVAETGLLEPPPTLRALLAARLDRLGPGERGVLERAAVVGREFAPSDVAELVDAAAVPTVRAHLDVLVRRGFLRPGRDTRFRFRHGLLHDSVYRAAPKALRAELHERFADVLERAQADDEDVGYHLERAYLLRAELGPPDRHARRLAEDAGRRLGAAGIRSWKHGEAGGASRLLERATALLPKEDEERRELLCELGIAFHTAGDPRRADDVLLEAEETAARAGDRRIELRAQIELAALRLLGDPHGSAGPLLELAEAAVPVFESLGDDRALGRTWMLSGWVHGGIYCRNAIWERSAEHALLHYRRAGSPPATCIGHIAAALYFGPTPASAAVARCSKLLEDEVDDLAREASVAAYLGGLHAMAARFDVAWSLLDRARGIYLDLGRPGAVARTCAQIEAATARLAGEPERAIAILDESCGVHRSMENWSHLGTQAAELADALAVVGRDGEAEEWLYLAESHSPPDDVSAQLSWRPVRARLLARAGEVDRAEAVAREAVAIAEATDALNQRASALLALAECLVATGERAEASEAVDRALRLYDLKENAAAAARLRSETAATASS